MPTPRHGYFLKDGTRIPSVTTILSRFKDSAGLIHWAWEQGREGKDYRATKGDAADIGTAAHAMVEAHIAGGSAKSANTLTDPEKHDRAQSSFEAYVKWAENFKVKIVASEIQLVSEKYKYGGTPDAIGLIGNELVLLDWKTSNSIYEDYLIQLAAYKNLWEENNPERPISGGFHLLRFAKEHGDFTHKFYAQLNDEWEQFMDFRKCYERSKSIRKRAA